MATKPAASGAETDKVKFPEYFSAFQIGPFAEFNTRNLSTGMRAGTAMMKGAAAYWGHLGGFVGKRLASDVETARSFAGCKTGEDAARTHHEFLSKMIADYFNEMHELLSIGADIARGVAEPVEERAEETIHAVEAQAKAAKTAAG